MQNKKNKNMFTILGIVSVFIIFIVTFFVFQYFDNKDKGSSEEELKAKTETFLRQATAMGHLEEIHSAIFNLDSFHIDKRASSCELAKQNLSALSNLKMISCTVVSEKIPNYYSVFTISFPKKIEIKSITFDTKKKAKALGKIEIAVIHADLDSTDATSDGTGSIYERTEVFDNITVDLVKEGKEWKISQSNLNSELKQYSSLWNVGGDMVVSNQKTEKIGAFRLDKKERLFIPIEFKKENTPNHEQE